jgi:hypothetical protein
LLILPLSQLAPITLVPVLLAGKSPLNGLIGFRCQVQNPEEIDRVVTLAIEITKGSRLFLNKLKLQLADQRATKYRAPIKIDPFARRPNWQKKPRVIILPK